MAHSPVETSRSFQLPTNVVGPVDVGRLLREAQNINEFLDQAAVRQTGEPMKLPKTSKLLDEILQINKLNGLQEEDRHFLVAKLKLVKEKAPVVHLSFSADPSPQFMQKVVTWFRQNIRPDVLIRVGLQPTIGAGCMMRTNSKHFDLSLRQHFVRQYQFFVDKMHESIEEEVKTEVAS